MKICPVILLGGHVIRRYVYAVTAFRFVFMRPGSAYMVRYQDKGEQRTVSAGEFVGECVCGKFGEVG